MEKKEQKCKEEKKCYLSIRHFQERGKKQENQSTTFVSCTSNERLLEERLTTSLKYCGKKFVVCC